MPPPRKRRSMVYSRSSCSSTSNDAQVDAEISSEDENVKTRSKAYTSIIGVTSTETACLICRDVGSEKKMVHCAGRRVKNKKEAAIQNGCLNTYHRKCLAKDEQYTWSESMKKTKDFRCPQCIGEPRCFVCQGINDPKNMLIAHCDDTKDCGLYFHGECLLKHHWALFCQPIMDNSAAAIVRNNELSEIATTNDDEDVKLALKYAFLTKSESTTRWLCPRHQCHTCVVRGMNRAAKETKKGQFVRCMKCLCTYHACDECLPAGTEAVNHEWIVCPDHYEPRKSEAKNYHANVSWCFYCDGAPDTVDDGSLLCCDKCPGSFHTRSCLGMTKVPDEAEGYICDACASGKRTHYGDIVWVKLGSYRWWPARVVHPKNVPNNVAKLISGGAPGVPPGLFAVQYFGTGSYNAMTQHRVFAFSDKDARPMQHGDKNARLNVQCRRAFDEALKAYQEHKATEVVRWDIQPEYDRIRKNIPAEECKEFFEQLAKHKRKVERVEPCECKEDDPCGESCLLRSTFIECDSRCKLKGCQNRRFRNCQYCPVERFRTNNQRGWGLIAAAPIEKGTFVIEYVGELVDKKEMRRRNKERNDKGDLQFYFMALDNLRIIDAGPKGNMARFMNNSCDPNCETQTWSVCGDSRVGLFAIKDIEKGEELTFNYKLDGLDTEVKMPCHCGTKNCAGVIGGKPLPMRLVREAEEEALKKKTTGSTKKKVKPKPKRKTVKEDVECNVCKQRGDVLLCDVRECPRVHHASCLGLTVVPQGTWLCPEHKCEKCNAQSVTQCSLGCPNSYCKEHASGNIGWLTVPYDQKGHSGFVCCLHADLVSRLNMAKYLPSHLARKNRANSMTPSVKDEPEAMDGVEESADNDSLAPSATSASTSSSQGEGVCDAGNGDWSATASPENSDDGDLLL